MVVANFDLFSVMTDEEISMLKQSEKKMEISAGEVLYEEGIEEDVLYLVAEGLLRSYYLLDGSDENRDCISLFIWLLIGYFYIN